MINPVRFPTSSPTPLKNPDEHAQTSRQGNVSTPSGEESGGPGSGWWRDREPVVDGAAGGPGQVRPYPDKEEGPDRRTVEP